MRDADLELFVIWESLETGLSYRQHPPLMFKINKTKQKRICIIEDSAMKTIEAPGCHGNACSQYSRPNPTVKDCPFSGRW
jgi:hypothetical protein